MNKKPFRICFLADTHDLFDDRIYWKEGLSLLKHGYEIHFILAGNTTQSGLSPEGIHYHYIQRKTYHPNRYLNFLIRKMMPDGLYSTMLHKASELKADAYHIQDLRINAIGKKLKQLPWQPRLIYDVHEPYPENTVDYYTGPTLLKPLVKRYAQYIRKRERKAAANYDLIITTEENMQQRFKKWFPEKPVEIIYNYTNLPQPDSDSTAEEKQYDAIYTGGITERRGAMKILEAFRLLTKKNPAAKMMFLGSWFPPELKGRMESYIRDHGLQQNIILHDAVPFNEVTHYYKQSKIGLGIFMPIPTHRIILQIKIFEYMNFGLPIIGSNFGHLAEIVNKHSCGLTINPEDPEEIAEALGKLLSDESLYTKMSRNGKKAVQQFYRWAFMEERLVSLYEKFRKED